MVSLEWADAPRFAMILSAMQTCPRCQELAPPRAVYCRECGARLGLKK